MAKKADEPATPALTRVAGRYTIESELGAGGMGRVYAALDDSNGRRVALKHLHAHLAASREDLVTLFKHEYYTLKQLAHPLFVEVYDYGVDACGPYFTMELLSGRDLAKLAPLPWHDACRVLRDIASALAILHSRGLVYRDLSAHNVRLSRDGQAKLLDFGALANRDVAQRKVVGTPPYVAPEALHRQPLDARTDLYALGALAYLLLAGRHAYPANRLEQLRDFWRSPPRPPSAYTRDVPAALDALVLSLLSIDVRARPSHTAEVIDRLGAIAELEPLPDALAARAYLNRPKLVERVHETLAFRKQLLRMLRGRGGALCIESEPGMGRTRMLEELTLEAKLLGALVLHARASAGAEKYDVVAQLGGQLVSTLPDLAAETARPWAHVLGSIVPGLRDVAGDEGAEPPPADSETLGADERWSLEQEALGSWLDAVCRRRPLVLAVDDLQHCDEASLALIARQALAAPTQRLVVGATLVTDRGETTTAQATFRDHARVIPLGRLSPQATAELYRHVFGDVAYLPELASWADGVAQGNAQNCMVLAQDLVDRGVVRFADGVWVLPVDLQREALPQSLAQTFAERLDSLSEAARDVAATLCVAGKGSRSHCIAFCADRDEAEVFMALDELLAADLVMMDGDTYALRQRAIADAVGQRIGAEAARTHHRRVGMALAADGPSALEDRMHAAFHLLRGGEDRRGAELVLSTLALLEAEGYALDERGVEALELALEACERLGRPARDIMRLRLSLIPCAFFFDHSLVRHGLPALDQLERDCGMDLVAQQDPSLPLAQRAIAGIGKAAERYASLPESERVFDPIESATEYGKALLTVQGIFASELDVGPSREICARFEPLAELSPVARLLHDAARAGIDALCGRYEVSLELQESVLQRTLELMETGTPLDQARLGSLLATMAYLIALRRAFDNPAETLRMADMIDRTGVSRHRSGAAMLRVLAHYLMGDLAATERYRAQYEERLVRHRQHNSSGVDLMHRLHAHALGDDLLELKALRREVETLCAERPGYQPLLHVARGHLFRLRGELEQALFEYEEAARLAPPGVQGSWVDAISHVVVSLVELGRLSEARGCIELARSANAEHELGGTLERRLLAPLALLEAMEGDVPGAIERLQTALYTAEAEGHPRLVRGHLLRHMLRVALIAGDAEMFHEYAKQLRAVYGEGDNRALHGAYERLMERARADGLLTTDAASSLMVDLAAERSKIDATLSACTDAHSRAQCALTMLAEDLHAAGGYLFVLRAGQLELAAAPSHRATPPESLMNALADYLTAELAEADAATATSFDQASTSHVTQDDEGRSYRPVLLRAMRDGEPVVAGIAALEVENGAAEAHPSWSLVNALSNHLIRAGDVQPERSAC